MREGELQFSCLAAAASSFHCEKCIYVPHLSLQEKCLAIHASETSKFTLVNQGFVQSPYCCLDLTIAPLWKAGERTSQRVRSILG